MQRKSRLFLSTVLAFSLCTAPMFSAFAQEASTEDANTQDTSQPDTSADSSSDAANTDTAVSSQEGSPSDIPYEKGTLTDTDYESTWLNLKFTPPSTVIMNTEEEMQSVMQQGQASLSDSTGVALNEDSLSGTVYEMMASSATGFPYVNLVVEDAVMENMNADQYLQTAQQVLDATGQEYTYTDITDTQIGGQDFRAMESTTTINDYQIIQKYCTRRQGEKFVSIILSYTTDTTAEADEILAAFTPLNTDTEAASAE